MAGDFLPTRVCSGYQSFASSVEKQKKSSIEGEVTLRDFGVFMGVKPHILFNVRALF